MSKSRRIKISILAGLMALVMVLGCFPVQGPMPVQAKSSSEIKKEINALEEERDKLNEELARLDGLATENMNEMEKAVNEKSAVDQQVAILYQQIATINAQITAYGALIAEKQTQLDDAEAQLAQLKEDNEARIRAMEKNSMTSSYWAVIFEAENFLDMLDQLNMVAQIQQADKQMIKELAEAAAEVETAKQELEAEKVVLENTKVELQETEEQLIEKRARADALLEELMLKHEEYQVLVEDAEATRAEMNAELDKLEDQYDAAKYKEYLATLPPPSVNNGGGGGTTGGYTGGNQPSSAYWMIPCNYTRFSSPYGWRIHPVYKDWRFHYGVDLGAPEGTPIYATRSGTVSFCGYDWSSGYNVNINHGDGFSSRYLHMTHYIVYSGQYVNQGQIIGYVGSTGTSTGPHLHFSVYYKGVSQDPAAYIAI